MDTTQVINNIFDLVRKYSYVNIVDGNSDDPIQLEVSDSMTMGAIFNLKNFISKDSDLQDGTVDEIEVDVSPKNEDVNVITFLNLTRGDYSGDRYEVGQSEVEITPGAIKEEMMG